MFNFAPAAWKEKKNKPKEEWPSYKLENQTDHYFKNTVVNRLKIAKLEGWIDPPTGHLDIVGNFDLDTFDFEKILQKTEFEYANVAEPF